jgi:hypothetical protein
MSICESFEHFQGKLYNSIKFFEKNPNISQRYVKNINITKSVMNESIDWLTGNIFCENAQLCIYIGWNIVLSCPTIIITKDDFLALYGYEHKQFTSIVHVKRTMTLQDHIDLEYEELENESYDDCYDNESYNNDDDNDNNNDYVSFEKDTITTSSIIIDRFNESIKNDNKVMYCICCRNYKSLYVSEELVFNNMCMECVNYVVYGGYC